MSATGRSRLAAYGRLMKLMNGVRPAAGAFMLSAALAACGGGGGGGGHYATPVGPETPGTTPAPTTSPANGYTAPTGAVTAIAPSASGNFGSAILAASASGTLVVQSDDTPAEQYGATDLASSGLSEYPLTITESAGIATSALHRAASAVRRTRGRVRFEALPASFHPRLDPRTATAGFARRGALALRRAPGIVPNARSRRPAALAQGAQRTFHIVTGAITHVSASSCPAGSTQVPDSTICYADISATLQAVSTHAYVWVDDALQGSQYHFPSTDWPNVATTFDADYPIETQAFAPAFLPTSPTPTFAQCPAGSTTPFTDQSQYQPVPDLSGGDPHISIVITAALDGTGEGGYFDSDNLLNDQELNCGGPHVPSNDLPMVVLGDDRYTTTSGTTVYDPTYWDLVDMKRSMPHEFQHYLHALNKAIGPQLTDGNGMFDDSFVDEGCSELAEDIVNGGRQQSDETLLEFEYLYAPANYSLTAFTGYAPNPTDTSSTPTFGFYNNTAGSYGQAYLFMRYLYDRFGGSAALHRLYADLSPGQSGTANTGPVVAAAGNGESFGRLYGDFALAIAARNELSTNAAYRFSSQVPLMTTVGIPLPGGETAALRFDGPTSSDDLTLSDPYQGYVIELQLGQTVGGQLLRGATAFYNGPGDPGVGATVLGSAPRANAFLNAGLAQGGFDYDQTCASVSGSSC